MNEELTSGASEAIEIADKHLARRSVEARKALALDIVSAISRCEQAIADEIIAALNTVKH